MFRYCIFILLTLFFLGCKKQKKEQVVQDKDFAKEVSVLEKTDFSTIPLDTLIVSGKEIVFLIPSKEELKLLKNHNNSLKTDSVFKQTTAKVKQFLKFPENIKISYSAKRIIGINEGNRIRYYDKLSYFKSHYAMLLMYNRTFSFVNEIKTEKEYFTLIDDYYRNNFRFEKPIEQKYVISRNGLNIRQEDGTIDGKYNNGDLVNIVGYTDDVVEINDQGKSIKGRWAIVKWKKGGTTLKRYVFEGFLGDINEVKVFKDQICTGFAFNQRAMYGTENSELECLSKYLDLQLISKTEYNAIKTVRSSIITTNPKVVVTDNLDNTQNISLPIKDSVLVYKSKVGYSNSVHSYYGDVHFLNQYLIHHVYPKAEEQFYSFVDRTTGKETFMFADYPYITKDKQKIVSFVFDIYEDQFYIETYKINRDNTIVLNLAYNFVHWLKTYESKVKWISNSEFAIEIVNKNIWNGSKVEKPQYLKIKLKA